MSEDVRPDAKDEAAGVHANDAAPVEQAAGEAPPPDGEIEGVSVPEAATPDLPEAVPPARPLPVRPGLAQLAGRFPDLEFDERPGQDVVRVPPGSWLEVVAAFRDAGYDMFLDLTAVDYLRRRPRFDVVTVIVSVAHRHRIRLIAGVGASEPVIDSITSIFPGANFYGREAFDMFGIQFVGHPDLTRILLPDDWEGYPLRKDFPVGSVPVQFKESHKAR